MAMQTVATPVGEVCAIPDYYPQAWDSELPGKGLPSTDEINDQLFGPEPTTPPPVRVRAWLSGIVVCETNDKGQPTFANWAKSSLRTTYSPVEPENYQPPQYVHAERPPVIPEGAENLGSTALRFGTGRPFARWHTVQ